MARWSIRVLVLLIVTVTLSNFNFIKVLVSEDTFVVIYTASSILFSLGLCQIMAFSFSGISNDDYVNRYRDQLRHLTKVFIWLFIFGTVFLFFKDKRYAFGWKVFQVDSYVCFSVFQVFCLLYFIHNFVAMHRIKDEIDDEIRKSKE